MRKGHKIYSVEATERKISIAGVFWGLRVVGGGGWL